MMKAQFALHFIEVAHRLTLLTFSWKKVICTHKLLAWKCTCFLPFLVHSTMVVLLEEFLLIFQLRFWGFWCHQICKAACLNLLWIYGTKYLFYALTRMSESDWLRPRHILDVERETHCLSPRLEEKEEERKANIDFCPMKKTFTICLLSSFLQQQHQPAGLELGTNITLFCKINTIFKSFQLSINL